MINERTIKEYLKKGYNLSSYESINNYPFYEHKIMLINNTIADSITICFSSLNIDCKEMKIIQDYNR